MIKRFLYQINNVNKFNYNLKYIDYITIRIYGDKYKYKIHNYSASIFFNKDDISIEKKIEANTYEEVLDKIKKSIDDDIKL